MEPTEFRLRRFEAPTSGRIMGALVGALELKPVALGTKQARRFFAGEIVSPKQRRKIFRAFASALVTGGLLPQVSHEGLPPPSEEILATVIAIEYARDHQQEYGEPWASQNLVWQVQDTQDSEDFYRITLAFRPSGRWRGEPGLDEFTVEKTGPIRFRQILAEPVPGRWRIALPPMLVALAAVAAGGLIITLFVLGGRSGSIPTPTATPTPLLPTVTPTSTPTPTVTPTATPTPHPG